MSISRWTPAQTISPREQRLLDRHRRQRKLFSFLRLYRSELFDEAFQVELETMYRETGAGRPPCPPALMAMALLLQGYEGLSDADAVEHTASDARWQMVLDRLGQEEPAFGQGTLVDFRSRMIRTGMDLRLLQRSVELANRTLAFDAKKLPKSLRVAIDSAPFEGAARVEDTINLLWHAGRKIVEGLAMLMGCDEKAICAAARTPLLLGSSAKAALDVDWGDRTQQAGALERLVDQLESLVAWMVLHQPGALVDAPLVPYLQALGQVMTQDLESTSPPPTESQNQDAAGTSPACTAGKQESGSGLHLRQGVAKDRRITIEDEQMRHGRKSATQRIDGYKRHITTDLDTDLILSCALTPANQPEEEAVPAMEAELVQQGYVVEELHVDQAYARCTLAQSLMARGGQVICRPRTIQNGELYSKLDFVLNWKEMTVTCPAGQCQAMELGRTVKFDGQICGSCGVRQRCTSAKGERGRTLSIARDECLQEQRREQSKTPEGRAKLRQRVRSEHRLAHVVARQGDQARYLGTRKNLYDLRRASTIQNLETIHRSLGVPMAA